MKATSGHIFDLWSAGGPFVGDEGAPNGYVTVETTFELRTHDAPFADFRKTPVRWFQRADGSEEETIVPNVRSITRDESVDQDAWTCTIVLENQKMDAYGEGTEGQTVLGHPGYYSPNRGRTAESGVRWGHTQNEWNGVLTPNALLRTFEGYGGKSKTLAQALADGNVVQTGTWLVDEDGIQASPTDGTLTLKCRNMAKLLIDQTIYPPLVPRTDADGQQVYPLEYCRWRDLTGSGVASPGIGYGTAVLGDYPGGGVRNIVGIAYGSPRSDLEGYWLAGDDGGVFTLGYNQFQGSASGTPLNDPITGIAPTADGAGYWLVGEDGGVFSYGTAGYYGSVPDDAITISDAVGIAATHTGLGYIIAGGDGGVYTYGDATFDGSGVGVVSGTVVAVAHHPSVAGYWLVTNTGHVYAFGGADHFDGLNGAFSDVVDIVPTPTGDGYYLLRAVGAVYSFGAAPYFGSPAEDGLTLNDDACSMVAHPDGNGYWIAAGDGGVFTYGGGMNFYGSLPGPFVNIAQVDGNYEFLEDIVKDIALWSGFWLNDGGTSPDVYGNIESTGTHADCLPREMFDKQAPINPVTAIKEIVGFLVFCDAEGALHFESPNFWDPGNFLPNGTHTAVIPSFDEAVNVFEYSATQSDQALRSEIIISSHNPDGSVDGTLTTTFTPTSRANLRGLVKPFMWVNELFVDQHQQDLMAELIDLHIWMQQRFGSVTVWANPLLDPNDQVWIYERQSSESDIHYIRGIHTELDLRAGTYTSQVTTNWLAAEENDWGVVVASAIARPATIVAVAAVGVATFPQATVRPSTVQAFAEVGVLVGVGGAIDIDAATVAATATVPAPTVRKDVNIPVLTVAATATVPAPTVTTS